VAEGAKPVDGDMVYDECVEPGGMKIHLGGAAVRLAAQLKAAGCEVDIRETILGHLQRGGHPNSFDRILASQFGIKAFELVLEKQWGSMVAYHHPDIVAVPLLEAISQYNYVKVDSSLVHTARGLGINLGD